MTFVIVTPQQIQDSLLIPEQQKVNYDYGGQGQGNLKPLLGSEAELLPQIFCGNHRRFDVLVEKA